MIKAVSLDFASYQRDVYPVTPAMLIVQPNAEYYGLAGENTVLFYPYNQEDTEYCYTINGKKYKTIGIGLFEYYENYVFDNQEVQQTLF